MTVKSYDINKAIQYNLKRPGAMSSHRAAQLVANWQDGHGLEVDGALGPLTISSIDTSLITPAPTKPGPVIVAPPPPPPLIVPPASSGPTIVLVGAISEMTVAKMFARWEAAQKLPVKYVLGAGGKDCKSDTDPRSTITKNGVELYGADCTGASDWADGTPKFQPHFTPYGGWMNTDAIIMDARGKQEVWELLDRPIVGCGLVFCGIDLDHDGSRDRIGHKATARRIDANFDPKKPDHRLIEIWDCAGSNSNLPGSVGDIAAHPAGYFNGKDTFKGVTNRLWATVYVWNKNIARP